MTRPAERWRVAPGGLAGPCAVLSAQRFPVPPDGVVAAAPRSCGALPFANGEGGFWVCVPEGEAFWIGLVHDVTGGPAPAARARRPDGETVVLTFLGGPKAWHLPGFPRLDRAFAVFALRSLATLKLRGPDAPALRFAGADEFAARTGAAAPPPLAPGDAYGGQRLP